MTRTEINAKIVAQMASMPQHRVEFSDPYWDVVNAFGDIVGSYPTEFSADASIGRDPLTPAPELPAYNAIPPCGAPRNGAEEIANVRAEIEREGE